MGIFICQSFTYRKGSLIGLRELPPRRDTELFLGGFDSLIDSMR
jgi:hypothetical protein